MIKNVLIFNESMGMNIRKTENRVKFASVFTQLLLFEHPIIPLKKIKSAKRDWKRISGFDVILGTHSRRNKQREMRPERESD